MISFDELKSQFGRATYASCVDGFYEKEGSGESTVAQMLRLFSADDIRSIELTELTGHGFSHFVHIETPAGNINFMADRKPTSPDA